MSKSDMYRKVVQGKDYEKEAQEAQERYNNMFKTMTDAGEKVVRYEQEIAELKASNDQLRQLCGE